MKVLFKRTALALSIVAMSANAAPPGLDELPPGRLKDKIQNLPQPAQKRALEWLERFDIPEQDFDSIDVDKEGGIFYIDPQPTTTDDSSTDTSTSSSLSVSDAFALHSNPGATKVIYLDFDGHTLTDTAWNSEVDTYYAKPFDRDGAPYSFSSAEADAIGAIWHRVAEDYAAFDVDVTTEVPSQMGPETGRILITHSTDENGQSMPYSNAGGVAYIGVWGASNYPYYQPALVYFDNLGGGASRYVAEAASHEMGHNQGLSHDGTSDTSYYAGHGSGYTDWAPIMGNAYDAQVSQWSRGEYDDANNTQDDIAIIAGNLGQLIDRHGDAPSSATLLDSDSEGNVLATNPETDPFNRYPANKGTIINSGDTDYFQFEAGDGDIQLTLTPAWDAYRNDNARGANLGIEAVLMDANGNVLQSSNPSGDTDAQLQHTVTGGTYYLAVTGVGTGSTTTGYDDYGSHGQYFIRGSLPVVDSTNTAPVAEDDSVTTSEDTRVSIAALANDSDVDGDTLTISLVSDGDMGSASTDGTAIDYTPDPDHNGSDAISYSVTDGNGGSASATVFITVDPVNDAPLALDDTLTLDQDTSASVSVLANDTDVDGDTLSIAGVGTPGHGSVTVDGDAITYTPDAGYAGADSFSYTVQDSSGATDTAVVAVTVNEAADEPVAPADLTVSDGGDGSAALSWSDTANEHSYEIQRETKHKKRDFWKGTTIVATLPADTTDYRDSSGSGTHRYRIRTHNDAGASAWSAWAQVTVTDSSGGNGNNGGGKGPNK